jgi:hypothetical protein
VTSKNAACDIEVFKNGEPVVLLDGSSESVEQWVQEIARISGSRVDWHYSGGIAQVLHLGDRASRCRVEKAITSLPKIIDVRIIKRVARQQEGLYRSGVTQAPEGAIAGSIDPLTGKQFYMIAKED